jgi:hypothetical protein
MLNPGSVSGRGVMSMPPCAACSPGECDRHQSKLVQEYYRTQRLQAMDSGAVARNFRVAEETEETARRRQQSGNDDEIRQKRKERERAMDLFDSLGMRSPARRSVKSRACSGRNSTGSNQTFSAWKALSPRN